MKDNHGFCGCRPPQHPLHVGEIKYSAQQINDLLDMIPKKADRKEILGLKAGFAPDEEDLTAVEVETSAVVKFKDRDTTKGKGYIILRTDKPIAGQMKQENTIYEVRYDFDLGGGTLEVPSGCVLDFKGGSFSNGSLYGRETIIKTESEKIFNNNLLLNGSWQVESLPTLWFGAKEDGVSDDTIAINAAIESARNIKKSILITGKLYVTETINVNGVSVKGKYTPSGNIMYYSGKRVGNITFDFMRNKGQGATITFNEMLSDCYGGSMIVSDVANPILKVTKTAEGNYGFNLNTIGVVGWIRNNEQVGLKCTYDGSVSYLMGNHRFNKVLVSGCGNDGVQIQSLELTNVDDCEFSCNNGYGMKIEGNDNYDTPTEYVEFNNCQFSYNRLDGICISKSFRKDVKFNACWLQMPGQYELGETNDYYGNRTIPSDVESIVGGIKILHGANVGSFQRVAEGLIIDKCYGELVVKAVHIYMGLGACTINKLSFTNNHFLRYSGSTNSTMLYLSANYMDQPFVWGNYGNLINKYVVKNTTTVVEVNAEAAFLDSLPSGSISSNIVARKVYGTQIETPKFNYTDYGIRCNTAQEGESVVTTDIVQKITKEYYPDNTPTVGKIMFTLLIGYHRNYPGLDTALVFDIIVVTKESVTDYIMTNVTKNIESLRMEPGTGIISLTCPSWHIVKVQRLDFYNSFL